MALFYESNEKTQIPAFENLTDVDFDQNTLANGQVPVYNATTRKWENAVVDVANKFNSDNVAAVETGNTASQTYNVGDLLVFNGILQNVTQAIAQGTNFQIGANIENTTVEKEILKAKTKLLFSVPYDYSSIANARVAYNAIGKYIRDNGLNTYDNFHHFILIGRNSTTGVADSFFIPVAHGASKNKIGTINFYKFQFDLTSSTFLYLRDVSVDVTGGNTAHFGGMNFSLSDGVVNARQITTDGSFPMYFDTLELHWTDSFVGL